MSSRSRAALQERREARRNLGPQSELQFVDQISAYIRKQAHANPEKFALTCLGVGFVLGWKLKPW